VREYLLVIAVAAATTYLLGGLTARLARRVGAVPAVRERDVHTVPVPRLGGLAIVAGIGVAFLLASTLPFLRQAFAVSHDVRAVYLGVLVLAAVGVLDDTIGLDSLTKFAGQVLAAGVVVLQGLVVYWLPLPGVTFSLPPSLYALLTIFLLVVAINAVNFVDGLDGLAAGIVAIGGGAFFLYTYLLAVDQNLLRASTAALIAAAVSGACLGFLPHNVYPAKVIMGDTGAMVLGLVLASSSVSLIGQLDPAAVSVGSGGTLARLLPTLLPLLLPVAVVALPFTDLVLAVVRRVSAGRSPFSPDKQHLHHRLLQVGHSHRRAVGLLWFWAAVLSFGMLAIGLRGRGWVIALVLATVVLGITLTLAIPERVAARRRRVRRARGTGRRPEPPPDPMAGRPAGGPVDRVPMGRADPPRVPIPEPEPEPARRSETPVAARRTTRRIR